MDSIINWGLFFGFFGTLLDYLYNKQKKSIQQLEGLVEDNERQIDELKESLEDLKTSVKEDLKERLTWLEDNM